MEGNKNYCIYLDGTSHQRIDGSWLKLPNTCDGNVVKNSYCNSRLARSSAQDAGPPKFGKGIRVDGLCGQTEMLSLKIVAKSDCKFFTEGSDVKEDSVLCMDRLGAPAYSSSESAAPAAIASSAL
jgi:hypothetical protein